MSEVELKKQDVAQTLTHKLNLFFREGKGKNGWYAIEGKKILRITLPHGKGEIPPGILNSIRNQLKLSNEQFRSLIQGPLSGQDYEDIIREKIGSGIL